MTKLMWLASVSAFLLILPRNDSPDMASLGGRVTNEDSVPIAGASVSARNRFSGDVAYASSDVDGLYKLTGLKHGRYSAFAAAEGHSRVWVPNVFLYSGQHTSLDFVLTKSQADISADDCAGRDPGSSLKAAR
jgi:Carboxypeptidase regulatory-like domain